MKKIIVSLGLASLICWSDAKAGVFTSGIPLMTSAFLTDYYLGMRDFGSSNQQGNIDGQPQAQEPSVREKVSTGVVGGVIGAFSIAPTLFFQFIGAVVDSQCGTFFLPCLELYRPSTLALTGMALGGVRGIYQKYQRRQTETDPRKRDLAYTLNSRETWGVLGAMGGALVVRVLLSHALGSWKA